MELNWIETTRRSVSGGTEVLDSPEVNYGIARRDYGYAMKAADTFGSVGEYRHRMAMAGDYQTRLLAQTFNETQEMKVLMSQIARKLDIKV